MVAKRRAYPHKSEDERRIVVSFSISGSMLADLRNRLEMYMHTQPTKREIQSFTRGMAYEAIEAYLASPFVPDEEE